MFVNKAVFPTSYDYAAVVDVIFITLSFAVILDVKNNCDGEKKTRKRLNLIVELRTYV